MTAALRSCGASLCIVLVLACMLHASTAQKVECKAANDIVAAFDNSGSVWFQTCPPYTGSGIESFSATRCDNRRLPKDQWCVNTCGHEAIMGWLAAIPTYFDLRPSRAQVAMLQWADRALVNSATPETSGPTKAPLLNNNCTLYDYSYDGAFHSSEKAFNDYWTNIRFPSSSLGTASPAAMRLGMTLLEQQATARAAKGDKVLNQILLFLTDGACSTSCSEPGGACNQLKATRDEYLQKNPKLIIIAIGVGSGIGSCDSVTKPCLITDSRTDADGCGECELVRIASPGTDENPLKFVITETDFTLLEKTLESVKENTCVCQDNCSGHGQCFNDGTCLCDVGYFGDGCEATFVPGLIGATAAIAALAAGVLFLHRLFGSSAVAEEEEVVEEEIYEEPEVMEDLIIEAPMMIEPTMDTDANAAGAPPATDNRPMFSPASRVQPTTFNRGWKAGGATFV